MKKIIILLLIGLAMPVIQLSASVKLATVINENGNKLVVTVGSKIPFGYKLYTPSKNIGASNINYFNSVTTLATTTTAGGGVVVLPGNGGRKYTVITNTGGTIAYLAFSNTATPTSTPANDFVIPLPASGGSYTINLDNLYKGQIVASSSAAVVIRTLEANY